MSKSIEVHKFISLPADGTDSVRTKRLLALSGLFRWAFFHLTSSSLMKWPFLPSVPCSRSPTYSSISSAFSMDRMYLHSRGKTWVVLLEIQFSINSFIISTNASAILVNIHDDTFLTELANPGVNSDAPSTTPDRLRVGNHLAYSQMVQT